MTDEERQKLIKGLRYAAAYNNPICDAAADEMERLAALAQSDAGPVAWQYREPDGEWQMCDAATDIYYRTSKYEIRPLYAAPPRPDAEPDPNLPDPNFDPVEAAQVDARSIDEASKRLEVQSNAEPVGWRWRYRYSENEAWSEWDMTKRKPATDWKGSPHYQVEPLYTAPSRPDASAGLIEAAKHLTASANQIKKQAENLLDIGTDECKEQAAELAIIEPCLRAEANYLRARAADRSEK